MRLAISNIAWDVAEDEQVAMLLQCYAVNAIDIAPGKYFPLPAEADSRDIVKVRQWWANRGVEITGMQSLLFGTSGLNVFGLAESQTALLAHLGAICRIGGVLGATKLVFGSPRNRDRSGLSDAESLERGTAFFRDLGDVAAANGVIICLEPNPPCYGANFMTTSAETAQVVETVNHPAIQMQLDTGAITINGEDPASILSRFSNIIGHVHASEPNLVPLGDGGTSHEQVYIALSKYLPGKLVSVEMVATQNESHLTSIERALRVANRFYNPAEGLSNQ